MSFEGIGKYFWLLFLVYFIIYLTVKVCLSKLFKVFKQKSWKAYVPIYNKLVLVNVLDLKKMVFYMTLVPFVRFYYFYVIIKRMLEVFEFDQKDALMFLLVPMYKFPELIYKNPVYRLHSYEETEKFYSNEKSLFDKEKAVEEIKLPDEIGIKAPTVQSDSGMVINPTGYDQTGKSTDTEQTDSNKLYTDSVFTNSELVPDERKETIIEAKEEIVEEVKNPFLSDAGRPKVCPKCGTKLEPTAGVCFFCGTKIS